MENQKMINLLGNTPNQPSKFKTKNCFEINDESWRTYNEDNTTRFKISMFRSRLCDYSEECILVEGTIIVESKTAHDQPYNAVNKKVIFKNYGSFTNCISRINNTQVDDAHDIDAALLIYNLIEYSDNYSKTFGTLRKYCRDESALVVNAADTTIDSFKIKGKNNRWNRLW